MAPKKKSPNKTAKHVLQYKIIISEPYLNYFHLELTIKLNKQLNINLLPFGSYQTGMNIRATLRASENFGFPIQNIVFEVTESEMLTDHRRLIDIIKMYQEF